MKPKDVLGKHGEQLAAEFLGRAGLDIVDRNWRCQSGEIDIVAVDGNALVICEVKTRSGTGFGTPLEAITWQKARRLRRLAAQWVRDHGVVCEQIRIDVIGILQTRRGEFTIEHVRGIG
jgi:putative endonuclease